MLLFLGISVSPVLARSPSVSPAQFTETLAESIQPGKDFYDQRDYPKAINTLKRAEALYESTGDTLNQLMTLSNLSLAYQQEGQWQEARQAITTALEQLKQPSSGNPNNYANLFAQAQLVKGQLEMAVGQPEAALQAWQKAYAKFDQIKDTNGKQRSQLYQVLALQELGFYQQAFKMLLGIPELFQDSNPLPEKVIAYRTLGNLVRVIGPSEDLEELKELIPSLKTEDNKTTGSKNTKTVEYLALSRFFLNKSFGLAKSEQDKAEALLELGNTSLVAYKHAKDAYDRASDRDKNGTIPKSKLDEALAFYNQSEESSDQLLSKTQAELNQYSLLLDYIDWLYTVRLNRDNHFSIRDLPIKLRQLQDRIGSNLKQSHSSHMLVNAQLSFVKNLIEQDKIEQSHFNQESKTVLKKIDTSNFEQIKKWLDDTYKLAESIQDSRGESYSLGYLGRLYEQYGKDDAYKHTKEALIKVEEIAEQRKDTQALAYQWQWQLGRILSQKGKVKEAITAYEEAVKILELLRGDLVSFSNPDLQFSFRDSVEPVYREYVDLLLTDRESFGTLNKVSEAQEALQKAQRAIEDLQVAELENFLKCQLLNTRRAPIYKVIDEKHLNAATIYTILLKNRLEVILRLPGKEQLFRYTAKDADKESVERELTELRQAIEDGRSPEYQSDNYPTQFRTVYNWILGGIMADSKLRNSGVKTLVFVLDGALRNIPMAALYDGKQFLIEKYSVALNLGIEFSDRKPLRAGKFRILAAGLSRSIPGYSGLDGVKTELKELKIEFPGGVTELEDEEFNVKNIRERILQQDFDVIHLATHGLFSSDPETTYIRTFDKELNVNEMEQILQKRTADRLDTIGLLFLSACQTAIGDKRATLGIAGMAVRTGANSVIATLFDAQDAITPELAVTFYQELGKPNVTKADALRSAQLRLLQSGGNNDMKTLPRNWAPFILIGNWQ